MKMTLSSQWKTTDRFGRETYISVLMADGVPVATIHSQDKGSHYNDDAIHQEHVIQGLQVRYDTEKYWHEDKLDVSCPSRSRMVWRVEDKDSPLPGDVDIALKVLEDYEEDQGFQFLKYGEKGQALPADASPAFMRGVELGKNRTGRIISKGKLTGNARSW